jgi:hypothetical protein
VADLAELARRPAGATPGELLAAIQKRLPAPKGDDMAVLMYTS